jgi:hypothetical protein
MFDFSMDDNYGLGVFATGTPNFPSSPNYTGDILKGVGTGLSMFGEYEQGIAEKSAYDFNATLDEYSAEAEKVAGAETQREIGIGEESMLSTQRAMYAKAGVTESGSPLDVMLQSASNAEMTKSIANYNSAIKELQYKSKASQDKYYGQQAQEASQFQMANTLLSGVGSIIGLAALI